MNMMPVTEEAKRALREAFTQALAPVPVTQVDVVPDHDKDGEEILWVTVVIDDDAVKVDGRTLTWASVKAHKALGLTSEARYPIVEYVSASDTGDLAE